MRDLLPYVLNSFMAALYEVQTCGVSASSTRSKKSYAYSIIKEETSSIRTIIDQLQKIDIRWKSIHNDLASMSMLPGEVLCRIFEHLDLTSPTWLRVTHVCSRWRKEALGFPRLWRRPLFHDLGRGEEMVRRAKSVPLILDVELNPSGSPSAQVRKMLSYTPAAGGIMLKYAKRQRPFSNGVPTPFIDCPELMQAAPLLRSIMITSPDQQAGGLLPTPFPLADAPLLRHLILENWNLRWNSPINSFTSLTHLDVACHGDEQKFRHLHQSMHQILPRLAQLQSIQVLRLFDVFADLSQTDLTWLDSCEPLHFPKLRQLTFVDDVEICKFFFDKLSWSPSVITIMKARERWFSRTRDVQGYSHDLVRAFGVQLATESVYSMALRPLNERYHILLRYHHNVSSDPTPLQLVIPPVSSIESGVLAVLPLGDLHRFTYTLEKPLGTWDPIQRLESLHELIVRTYKGDLIPLLSQPMSASRNGTLEPDNSDIQLPPSASSPNNINRIPFPSLRKLWLMDWEFCRPIPEENFGLIGVDWFSPTNAVQFDEFLQVLRNRRDEGRAIAQIWLQRCKGLKNREAQELRDVCSEFKFWKK